MANRFHNVANASQSIPPENTPNRSTSERPQKGWLRKWFIQATAAGALGLLLTTASGCSLTSGWSQSSGSCRYVDDFMTGVRHRRLAEKAWKRCNGRFRRCRFPKECKAGFIAGYLDVAGGGNGCVPAIAPREYWGWRYQNPDGHKAVNIWFQAFPAGVQAAEIDGVGNWIQITPSRRQVPAPVVVPDTASNPSGIPVEVHEEGSATRSGSSTRIVSPSHHDGDPSGSGTRSAEGSGSRRPDGKSNSGSGTKSSGRATYGSGAADGSGSRKKSTADGSGTKGSTSSPSKSGSGTKSPGGLLKKAKPDVVPLDKPNFDDSDPFSFKRNDEIGDQPIFDDTTRIDPSDPAIKIAKLPEPPALDLDVPSDSPELSFEISDFSDADIEAVFGGEDSVDLDNDSLPFSFE